jgi:hypothetical protein
VANARPAVTHYARRDSNFHADSQQKQHFADGALQNPVQPPWNFGLNDAELLALTINAHKQGDIE